MASVGHFTHGSVGFKRLPVITFPRYKQSKKSAFSYSKFAEQKMKGKGQRERESEDGT